MKNRQVVFQILIFALFLNSGLNPFVWPKNVHGQTDIPWSTAGANSQRTSWTPNEAPGLLKALWVKRIVPYISQKVQPVAAENTIFVSTARGVYAFDADTGVQKWVYATEMPIGHSPTYNAGTLYAAGLDRKIHAINVSNGTKKWVFDASPEEGAGFSTSPLFAENTVFAGNRDGNMYAVDANTGVKKWKYKIEGTGPILFSAAYANGKIFFGAQDGNAYALNASNGTPAWTNPVKLPGMGFISWWPVVYNDKVIFTRTEEQRNTSSDFTGGNDFGYERDTIIGGSTSDNPAGQVITRTIGSQTKAADVKTNPNMPMTIPNYFENNPHQRNVFVINQSTGMEVNFDIDNDGKTDGVPILRSVQDWETAYPPVLSGFSNQNILYFRTPLFQNDAFPGSRATGWEYGTSFLSLPVSKHFGQSLAWPLDEYTGLSGGGRYIYWNLCCDRFVGSVDVSKSNTAYPGLDQTRQWRHLTGKIGENSGDLPDNYFNEMKKYFWSDPTTVGRFYASHGDNVGPAIYDGKMYAIRSNALIAFAPDGTGKSAPMSDVPAPSTIGEPAGVPSVSVLKGILETEVQKIVNAGHLKPGYGIVGNFDSHMRSALGDQLLDYWHTPGDIHYVLIRSLPHLSSGLQTQVKNYLTTEFNAFPPYQYSHIGWKDGKFRDSFNYPPGMASKIATIGPSTSTIWSGMWNWPPYQFYAMWLYAKENPSQAVTIFNSAKAKLSSSRPSYCSPTCPAMWPQAVNGLIAGYKGYVELAKLAGQPSTVYGPYETTLNSLLTERKNNFQVNLVQTLGSTGTNNAANYYATLIHAWNFMYLTPELGDYLNTNAKTTVQSAVNQYTAEIPMWSEALNREVQGEGADSPYQQTHAIFQAKALILKESYNELAKRLDAPMMVGDLYYLDNLVTTLDASTGPVPSPSAGSSPSFTPSPTPSYTIAQLKTLLTNYLTTTDSLYNPVEGKVNMLDASWVVKWLN